MTPDGIPTREWDHVHELAVEVVNATMWDDAVLAEFATARLLSYLQELRGRHGDLPSILGSLGGYTDDELGRYDLYARGVAEARRLGERKNLSILLESILELECLDGDQRAFWETQLTQLNAADAAQNGSQSPTDENTNAPGGPPLTG